MNTKTTAAQIVGISEDNIPECNIPYSRSWRSRLGLRTVYRKSDIINFNGPKALTMTMAGHNRPLEIPGQTSDSRVPLGFDAAWNSSLPFSSVLAVWREKESGNEENQANLRNIQSSGVCAMAFKFFGRQKEGKCRNAGMSCSACATMYVPPSPDSLKAAARPVLVLLRPFERRSPLNDLL